MRGTAGCVRRVSFVNALDFEREYVRRGRPVVVEGAVRDWSAVRLWRRTDYLRARVGHRCVPALLGARPGGQARGVSVLMSEFLDYLESKRASRGSVYLSDVLVKIDLPELLPDLGTPPFLGRLSHGTESEEVNRYRTLFLGAGSYSQIHMHPWTLALSCQIVGRKEFLLFPPSEARRLYPGKPWGETFSDHGLCSRVDANNPDLDRFPRFARAASLGCTLTPGDMLYIPNHWWHAVWGHDRNATVVCAYPTSIWQQLRNPGHALRAATFWLARRCGRRRMPTRATREAEPLKPTLRLASRAGNRAT